MNSKNDPEAGKGEHSRPIKLPRDFEQTLEDLLSIPADAEPDEQPQRDDDERSPRRLPVNGRTTASRPPARTSALSVLCR